MASLCGLTFWSDALVAMGAGGAEKNLESLTSKEFIAPQPRSSVPGTREYSFRNYLVHKVCLSGLLRHERKECHARLARWLESTGSTSIDLRRLIAQNYLLAGEEEQAALLYFDLGRACSAFRGEYAEALGAFGQCLEIARGTGNRALQREALGQVGILSMKTGKFDKASEILQEAIRLASSDCLVEREAEYTIALAGTFACLGDLKEALAAAGHARKLCSGLGNPDLNMQLEKMTAFIHYFGEDIETATESFIRAYDIAVESGNLFEIQLMMQNIGSCLFDAGKLDESRKYFEEAGAICEKEGFWETRHLNNAYVHYLNLVQRFDPDEMAGLMRELEFARRTNNKWDIIQVCILLGRASRRVSRSDDAKRYFEEAVKEARKSSFTYYLKMAERALEEVEGA
jgi:tetratricopeptide (TPR) repeat protein